MTTLNEISSKFAGFLNNMSYFHSYSPWIFSPVNDSRSEFPPIFPTIFPLVFPQDL